MFDNTLINQLPPVSSLTAEKAITIFEELRFEFRPSLFSKFLNEARDAKNELEKQISCIRFQLQLDDLDEYENDLQHSFHLRKPGPHLHSPGLKNINRISDNQIESDTELYFVPSGKYFVHGPDSAYAMMLLCRHILKEQEKIIEIEKISWPKMALSNIHISVAVRNEGNPNPSYSSNTGQYNICGTFKTSLHRKIDFFGFENENDPILFDAAFNQLAIDALINCKKKVNTITGEAVYYLNELNPEIYLEKIQDENALCVLTILDIIGVATGWSDVKLGNHLLSRTLKKVPVPESLQFFNNAVMKWTPDLNNTKSGFNGTIHTIPYQVVINNMPASEGIFAATFLTFPELILMLKS